MTDLANPIQTPDILADQYEFLALLGEGSNGKTFLAQHVITYKKTAIKALKLSQSENFKSFELFKREAEVLASIHIQGIPQFYGSILPDSAGDACYIIQEYVEAPSIQSYLDKGRKFTEKETLALLRALTNILNELQTVYTPPIIHRDIKPSNILCHFADQADGDALISPYLIDFGAVANPQNRNGGSTIAGTCGYMAPEQLLGECAIQSDFYALGATALQMLTGIPPYKIDARDFELLFEPVIQEHAAGTSHPMIALLKYLLEPKKENRPQTAKDLTTAIERVNSGHLPDGSDVPKPAVSQSDTQKLRQEIVKQSQEYKDRSSWQKTIGTLRAITQFHGLCLEYTFAASGKTWCGITNVADLHDDRLRGISLNQIPAYIRKHYKIPGPCCVFYNPLNPRLNTLDSIE